jgi:hypothetical protein
LEWTTEERRLGDLVPRDRNPVKISDHDAAHLKVSVDTFGQPLPLIVQPDGGLIDGHQRQKVLSMAEEYGDDTMVDVRVPNRPLTEEEVEELTIRLRRNTGEWDWDILEEDFDKDDLLKWGFLEEELGEWKAKAHKPKATKPDLEISPELFERHDYLLIIFDNEFDWQVACELLQVGQVLDAKVGAKSIQDKGIGRVISGADLVAMVQARE